VVVMEFKLIGKPCETWRLDNLTKASSVGLDADVPVSHLGRLFSMYIDVKHLETIAAGVLIQKLGDRVCFQTW